MCRQAYERQELAHKSTGSLVICLEPEVADLDFEFPFLCGFGAGVFVALALAVILRYLCSAGTCTTSSVFLSFLPCSVSFVPLLAVTWLVTVDTLCPERVRLELRRFKSANFAGLSCCWVCRVFFSLSFAAPLLESSKEDVDGIVTREIFLLKDQCADSSQVRGDPFTYFAPACGRAWPQDAVQEIFGRSPHRARVNRP